MKTNTPNPVSTHEDPLSLKQASKAYLCSAASLRLLVKKGVLNAFKHGKGKTSLYMLYPSNVEKVLRERKNTRSCFHPTAHAKRENLNSPTHQPAAKSQNNKDVSPPPSSSPPQEDTPAGPISSRTGGNAPPPSPHKSQVDTAASSCEEQPNRASRKKKRNRKKRNAHRNPLAVNPNDALGMSSLRQLSPEIRLRIANTLTQIAYIITRD